MPTDTWPLDSLMLPPLVLRPPHGPRLVRLLVLILAVIFYLPPAGWSPITNGPEGELAAAAQDLWNSSATPPATPALLHGPLALWLTHGSLALGGTENNFAARLPAALAAVAAIWLTLQLAERLGTLWEGFVAALMLLCSPGMFTLGRVLTPAPLAAALVAACVCCLQRGAEQHMGRRRWLLLAWITWGFATLAGGWLAGAVPAGMVLLLALFYPEARLRFRPLLSWEGGLVLALTAATMAACGFPPGGSGGATPWTLPAWQLVLWQIGLLFPWLPLLLPGAWCVFLQLLHSRPLEWNEALPLAWLAAGVGLMLAAPTLFSALLFWPAFAVWGAHRLGTLHHKTFLRWSLCIAALSCGGLYLADRLRELLPFLFPDQIAIFRSIPDYFWPSVTPVAFIAMLAFGLFAASAFCMELLHNRRFAVLSLFAAMIPAGFAFADIGAKFAPWFSDAQLARCLNATHATQPVIFAEGSRAASSSLRFYLGGDFRAGLRVSAPEADILSVWKPGAYLVIPRDRLLYWKAHLPGRFGVVSESGAHLLLAAQGSEP